MPELGREAAQAGLDALAQLLLLLLLPLRTCVAILLARRSLGLVLVELDHGFPRLRLARTLGRVGFLSAARSQVVPERELAAGLARVLDESGWQAFDDELAPFEARDALALGAPRVELLEARLGVGAEGLPVLEFLERLRCGHRALLIVGVVRTGLAARSWGSTQRVLTLRQVSGASGVQGERRSEAVLVVVVVVVIIIIIVVPTLATLDVEYASGGVDLDLDELVAGRSVDAVHETRGLALALGLLDVQAGDRGKRGFADGRGDLGEGERDLRLVVLATTGEVLASEGDEDDQEGERQGMLHGGRDGQGRARTNRASGREGPRPARGGPDGRGRSLALLSGPCRRVEGLIILP